VGLKGVRKTLSTKRKKDPHTLERGEKSLEKERDEKRKKSFFGKLTGKKNLDARDGEKIVITRRSEKAGCCSGRAEH